LTAKTKTKQIHPIQAA